MRMAATQLLAKLNDFYMRLKQSTFFTSILFWSLCTQGHAYPFSHWDCNNCYIVSHPSGRKLWIWHCRRSSRYKKHYHFLQTSTIYFSGGPGSRTASRGPVTLSAIPLVENCGFDTADEVVGTRNITISYRLVQFIFLEVRAVGRRPEDLLHCQPSLW